jgi:hypothetical protein
MNKEITTKLVRELLDYDQAQFPDGRLVLKDQSNWSAIYSGANAMRTVFKDGRLTEFDNIATIRNRARS